VNLQNNIKENDVNKVKVIKSKHIYNVLGDYDIY